MEHNKKESRLEEFINNPKKALWKLSFPLMFGMSVQAIYMMVDTAFLGRMVGATALAGLGYVFPFLFIIMGITFGLGSGATTVIAQFIGSEDKNNADNILQAINIDDLLKGPESYLLSLSLSFLNEHTDEIEKAHKEGIKFAEKILKKS